MRAIDTNVLIYAVIETSSHHAAARAVLTEVAESPRPWGLPWPCAYEFLRVVTHSRVYHPPMPPVRAVEQLWTIMASPSLTMLSETSRHVEVMAQVLAESGATGNLVHDAHIAALCLEHGVSELLTGDRDFTRFSGFDVTDPFA